MAGEFHCGHRRLRQGGELPKGCAEGHSPFAGCVRVSLTYNHFKFSSNERWDEMAGEFHCGHRRLRQGGERTVTTTTRLMQIENDAYTAARPNSKRLQAEAERYLPGGSSRATQYFGPFPFFMDRAEGHYVYDVDGHRYLDFMLNATTFIAGHANPDVVRAVQDQSEKGFSFGAPSESQVRLAKELCERVPSLDQVRFTNSGTEGTLNAIRLARAYTGRHKFAKFEGGYHGNHEYVSVSVGPPLDKLDPDGPTAIPEWPGQPPSVVEDVVVLPYNDLEGCERVLRERAHELACVIMEPVSSSFGYLPGDKSFLEGMRDLTRELGIVLIFDEVQSFRISRGGAQEYLGVIPDITTFGKVVGGGLPVGAWGGRADLMALYDPATGPVVSHAGTFNANPMTMVAGEATLQQLTPEAFQRMNALGEQLREKLRAVLGELDIDVQVTGIGSLFAIHFTTEEIRDYRSTMRGDQKMKDLLFVGLLNEGIMLTAKCAGALCTLTTESEVDALVDAVRRVGQRIT